MPGHISVGVIGATGKTGRSVVQGLLTSETNFTVTYFTRHISVDNAENQNLQKAGVHIVGYDLDQGHEALGNQLKSIDILISCITWEHLELQLPWIEAAKEAGVKRFVPSEWVGSAPKGKLDIFGAIQRAGLPYTIIDVGCWFEVFVPKIPSGRSDSSHMTHIDHRIVEDGNQKFGLTDMADIGKYVAQIVADPRTVNKHVFAYTEVLSMNQIWDTMAAASGETPEKDYITGKEIIEIMRACRKRLDEGPEGVVHPGNIMDIVNYNMGQYRISWCIRGDNTPEYAKYLGYLDFWELNPNFPRGRSLEAFYREVVGESSSN